MPDNDEKPLTICKVMGNLLAPKFNELRGLIEWPASNPLENVREFKIGELEMAYLTIDEVRILLAECENSRSKDLTTIVKICWQLAHDEVRPKA